MAEATSSGERVLVTGASGFVGSALIEDLSPGFLVRAAHRDATKAQRRDAVFVGDLSARTHWRQALEGVDAVVHLSGPAHGSVAPGELHRAIAEGTAALVEQAAAAGVRRFVFVSSIHACAKRTESAPLSEATTPHPSDAYGRAKLAAEAVVLGCANLAPIVLRPPLIYDARAKGNFARLLRLLDSPWPLPLGGIRNKRSVVSLASFNAAIEAVLRAPDASGLFHVCDGPSVSTSEMAALLRQGMGRAASLFTAPGLSAVAPPALTESLEVDGSLFRTTFASPDADTREGLVACGRQWAALR